jgi:hypothetical protein
MRRGKRRRPDVVIALVAHRYKALTKWRKENTQFGPPPGFMAEAKRSPFVPSLQAACVLGRILPHCQKRATPAECKRFDAVECHGLIVCQVQ